MVGRRNLGGAGIRQNLATGTLLAPKSGNIWPPSPDVGESDSGWNWLESGHGQKPTESGQNGRDPTGSDWIWPLIRSDLAKMAGIRLNLDGSSHWSGQIWAKWPGSGRIWLDLEEMAVCWPKWPGYGRIWPKWLGSGQNGRDPVRSDWIRRNPAILPGSSQTYEPKSGNGDRMLPNSGDSCIFAFQNFFVRAKRQKIFSRKLFFF